MRPDLTDITLVIDRSGSMASIRADAEGGINEFIRQQSLEPGDAVLTLVQFDTAYEFVHRGVPLRGLPPFTLEPRGSTALLDAVGRAIHETGARLSALPEADRPNLVLFVVTTDGEENSSREYTKAQVKQMIEHQQTQYQWHFTFLGADQDAFAEAGGIGIAAAGTAGFAKDKAAVAYEMASRKASRMRQQSRASETVSNSFTTDELNAMR
jgi:hypothetical protein